MLFSFIITHSIFSAHCGMANYRISISHRSLVSVHLSRLPAAAPERRLRPRFLPVSISSVHSCFVHASAIFQRAAITAHFNFYRKSGPAFRHCVRQRHHAAAVEPCRIHVVSQHQCLVGAARCGLFTFDCKFAPHHPCSDATGTISANSSPLLISVLKCSACASSSVALSRTLAGLGSSRCVVLQQF